MHWRSQQMFLTAVLIETFRTPDEAQRVYSQQEGPDEAGSEHKEF